MGALGWIVRNTVLRCSRCGRPMSRRGQDDEMCLRCQKDILQLPAVVIAICSICSARYSTDKQHVCS
jgi:predicted amidophosphoribosyltransferase